MYYVSSNVEKRATGNTEAVEFIKKLSTAASQHINFNGCFKFDITENPIDLKNIVEYLDKVLGATQKFDASLYKKICK